MQGFDLHARCDAKLTLECPGTGVVDLKRLAAAIIQHMQANQLAIRRFIERIVQQQGLNRNGCRRIILLDFIRCPKRAQRQQVQLVQPFALAQHPVAIAVGQQSAAIASHCTRKQIDPQFVVYC